jgi:hypothetical protein
LFVTLTDYYGYQQLLPIHDPPFVDVVDLSISHIPEQRGLRTAAELLRQLIKQVGGGAAKPLYSLAVLARVRLEYWISFWRVDTSAKLRGSSPRALQRST